MIQLFMAMFDPRTLSLPPSTTLMRCGVVALAQKAEVNSALSWPMEMREGAGVPFRLLPCGSGVSHYPVIGIVGVEEVVASEVTSVRSRVFVSYGFPFLIRHSHTKLSWKRLAHDLGSRLSRSPPGWQLAIIFGPDLGFPASEAPWGWDAREDPAVAIVSVGVPKIFYSIGRETRSPVRMVRAAHIGGHRVEEVRIVARVIVS
jgi:hypothetical protein